MRPLEGINQMGLSGEGPLGEGKTKPPHSNYHKAGTSRWTRHGTAGGGHAGLLQARGGDRRASTAGLRRAYNHRAHEVQRGPLVDLRDSVIGAIAEMPGGHQPDLLYHRPRPGADPRLVLQRRFQTDQIRACTGSAIRRHGGHGARQLGPFPPRPHPGPHHPRPDASQRHGDADGQGRPRRPLPL